MLEPALGEVGVRTATGVACQATLPTLRPLQDRRTCGICLTESPQWLWVVETLGFRIVWVWAPALDILPYWLKPLYPTASFTTNSLNLSSVDLVVSDSTPPGWVEWAPAEFPLVARTGCNYRGKRSRDNGRERFLNVSHLALGGLTSLSVKLNLRSVKPLRWTPVGLPSFLPSTVYSVASDTVDIGRRHAAPSQRTLTPARVQVLGHDVYHGGGLFPLSASAPRFLLPSVMHAPTFWCVRRLTVEEQWQVYDVPWRVFRLVSALRQERHLFGKLVPGRCLEHGLRTLLKGFGLMTEGGVLDFSRTAKTYADNEELGGSTKRARILAPSLLEEAPGAGLRRRVGFHDPVVTRFVEPDVSWEDETLVDQPTEILKIARERERRAIFDKSLPEELRGLQQQFDKLNMVCGVNGLSNVEIEGGLRRVLDKTLPFVVKSGRNSDSGPGIPRKPALGERNRHRRRNLGKSEQFWR